jgi:2,3-bisphosphoglycerate-independent phosphoglycerate mutase
MPLTHESVVEQMAYKQGSKFMLLVMDGLGGFQTSSNVSELSAAKTPNMDVLAYEGACGLHDPVSRGITAGSGAGHLGLFGYDPLKYEIGRGVITAAGIGFDLKSGDVAARANFCTLSDQGVVLDRRAGRISGEDARRLCDVLTKNIELSGVEFFLQSESEHRCLLVLRGLDLSAALSDGDPQKVGVAPLTIEAKDSSADRTVSIVHSFLEQARELLKGEPKANSLLLRGFDTHQELPSIVDRYQVDPIAIAAYPTYLGISRLLGFETLKIDGGPREEVAALPEQMLKHDFAFMHVKKTDSSGEDGDFDRKVAAIEEVDSLIPAVLDAGIQVLAITGDHSTPSQMRAHSWHPVPVVIWGGSAPADRLQKFDELRCREGSLGRFDARFLMPQLLASAGRLTKYGA